MNICSCWTFLLKGDHSFSKSEIFFWKPDIYYPLIRTRMYAYQGERNVSFSENFSYVLNKWSQVVLKVLMNVSLIVNLFQCRWFLFVPSENIKKLLFLWMFSGGIERDHCNGLLVQLGILIKNMMQYSLVFNLAMM